MLQTQVLQSFTKKQGRGLLRFGSLALAVGGSYGFVWHQRRAQNVQKQFDSVDATIEQYKPIELKSFNAFYYPWAQNDTIHEWEYKLVKITGVFKEERMFVRRAKDGKQGYLVFAPLMTSSTKFNTTNPEDDKMRQNHILVNLGWVPENNSKIEMTQEPLPTYERPEEEKYHLFDQYTGFTKDNSYIPEDEREPLTEVVGLVRRGEQPNIFRGRRNWEAEGVFNWVDLWYFVRLLRFQNHEEAKQAYIERVVPELEEDSENNIVPSTKGHWNHPDLTPVEHRKLSMLYALSSVVSLALFAIRR